MEIAQKAMDEKIIPLMQEENNLTTEYDKLIASAKIPFDGKELNPFPAAPLSGKSGQKRQKRSLEGIQPVFPGKCGQAG